MVNGQDFDPGRQMRLFQARMPSFVQVAVFCILFATTAGLAIWFGQTKAEWGIAIGLTGVVLSTLIAASIKVANQWGLEVSGIRLQDIDMHEELRKVKGSNFEVVTPSAKYIPPQ